MGIPTFRVTLRALFAVAGLLGVAAAQAQNITVAGANSTNDRVYSLNFGPKGITTTVQNTDWGSFGSIQSLAFIVNPTTSALDLLVADDTGGKISVYPGDFTKGPPKAPVTSTVVWTASQGGPAAPNGLSVDLAGDLFVVNTRAGNPQLWVFPAAGTGGCAPLASYSALCAPVLVDSAFPAGQVLVETTLVPSVPSGGMANTGDLLLLTSNPAMVLDYPFPAVSNANRSTLLTLPAGTTPGGLAFWPLDNSLLITNQAADSILRYSCCSSPVAMTSFASNLGGSGKLMYKIKTGYQDGVPYAFAVQAGSIADILEFGEGATVSGPGKLLATISQNINHPEGIAVSNAVSAALNACAQTSGGCNPTGLLSHSVPGSTAPKLVENVCVVPVDPRVTYNGNTWTCDGTALPVNKVCPGFDTTGTGMFIPGYMCGMSGDSAASNPRGFTLIETLTNNSAFNGTIIENVTDNVANEPACRPDGTLLWAPVAGEGTFVADGNTNETLELTDGCGTIHGGSSGGSLWGEGLALNTAFFALSTSTALAMLADNKYMDLEMTIQSELAANISPNVAGQLASAGGTGCVPLSKSYLDFAQFESGAQQGQDLTIAADLLSNAGTNTCDTIVTTNIPITGAFTQTPSSSPPVFNPSGQVRSRLASLYFTINSRRLGNPPNASAPSWPPSPQLAAPPGAFSTLPPPPDIQAACVPSGLYPPPGGCPILSPQASVVAGYTESVSFTLYGSNNGNSGCSLTSIDGTFNNAQAKATLLSYPFAGTAAGTVPAGTAAGNYTYTLTCAYPNSPNTVTSMVKASVQVLLPPTVSAPTMVASGSPVTVSWVQNGSTGCTLTGSDGENVANADSTSSVTYTPSVTAPVIITYTLACATPSNASATASVSITGTPMLIMPPGVGGGGPATIGWVLNGNTGCTLSDNGAGTPVNFPGPLASSGSATYNSVEADSASGVTFTLACSNITPVTGFLTVNE